MPKAKTNQYYEAIGRRKSATARVRLYICGRDKTVAIYGSKVQQGTILINKNNVDAVFPSVPDKLSILRPLKLTNNESRFVISCDVTGGGFKGQLDAIVLGISRAIELSDSSSNRLILKNESLLTRDSRVRERRKVGTGGKSRRKKQSPKR